MRFDVLTLFPELFAPLLTSGITRRAYESGQVDVRLHNPRDFAPAQGFYDGASARVGEMLRFRDVSAPAPARSRPTATQPVPGDA